MTDPLILARAVHFAATLALAGAVIFGAAVAGPALRGSDAKGGLAFRISLLRTVWLAFAAALISAAAWLVALAAQTSGHGAVEVVSDGTAWTVLRTTTIGHAMSVRLVPAALLATLLCTVSPARPQPVRWTLAALLAVAFTLSLVHSGHAAATRGSFGTLHRAADGLHLVAAAAWLGGLVPLAVLLAAARRGTLSLATAAVATTRFSLVGVLSVATLVATGIANGVILVGSVAALIGTDYGRLLLVKVALFLAMLALAAVNRLRLMPRLLLAGGAKADAEAALRPLIRNSVIETALGLAVLAIVGVLGTMRPGVEMQPTWPLSWRLDDAAFGDPVLRPDLVLASGLAAGAALAVVASVIVACVLRQRRWRLVVVSGGIAGALMVAAVVVMPGSKALLLEAHPTTFYVSPTGYAAASIMRGAEAFAIHCASCHGRRGRGDGPAGRFFRVKPADLTADHIYAHTDGDLYWWIANGIGDVMPPFAAALDEATRWSLIDFVHANADAARLRAAPGKVTDVGYRAPDFAAICPDGTTVARDDLRGRIARLVLVDRAGPPPAEVAASDVVTIAVPLGEAATGAVCRTDDADLAKALALYREDDAGALAGTELLVDASGALRAIWSPGGKPDWSDAAVLALEIAAIRDHQAARRPLRAHQHAP